MARFSRDHPEVKFLFPLITKWSPEKFGTANHISREYTFLSSMRMGKALERLITDPESIPPYTPRFGGQTAYPPITAVPTGPADPELLDSALAFYLYTSTLDQKYHQRISRRSLSLLEDDDSYRNMIDDKKRRAANLSAKKIKIGFDLSQLRARPVDITGVVHCNPRTDTQWIQVDGTIWFTYESPEAVAREPVRWPETSHIFFPTIVEDGVRKFDGYCPEPPSALSNTGHIVQTK
jgi:hypothetical protein